MEEDHRTIKGSAQFGYNRAARMIEMMAEEDLPRTPSRARVLVRKNRDGTMNDIDDL